MRWPAEWETHECTWMMWPARLEIWSDFQEACHVYACVANSIGEHEKVRMIVSKQHVSLVQKLLSSDIEIVISEIDDSWARDVLPIFLEENNKIRASCWDFNAWGNKFSPYDLDREIGLNIANQFKLNPLEIDVVLEGGSVHSNGNNILLTTEECLLNKNRNPQLNKSQLEDTLKTQLALNTIIWLPYGIEGDNDTDGHVDNVACFLDENTICIQASYDNNDANSLRHKENIKYLKQFHFDIVEIPQPSLRYSATSERLPLSYLNFYFCNEAIVMPTFEQKKADERALSILKEYFPRKNIHQIPSIPLVHGGGGIHCITKQQPLIQ